MAEMYEYHIAWSKESETFIAQVTGFPSLVAHGTTQVEALERITHLVEDTIETLKSEGRHVPEPTLAAVAS